MNQNGPVGLALVAEMGADREVQAHRFLVHSQRLNEVLNRLIGIVGEQKLQTILNGFLIGDRCFGAFPGAAHSPHKPASGHRNR